MSKNRPTLHLGRKTSLSLGALALMFTGTLITASPASAWYQNQCAHADGNLRLWESTYYSGACGEEPAGTNYSDTRGQAYNDGASVYLHTQSAENDDTYWLGVVLYDYTGYSGPSKQINTYQSSAGIGFVGVGSLQWWRN